LKWDYSGVERLKLFSWFLAVILRATSKQREPLRIQQFEPKLLAASGSFRQAKNMVASGGI
jgi:hypothetical protein